MTELVEDHRDWVTLLQQVIKVVVARVESHLTVQKSQGSVSYQETARSLFSLAVEHLGPISQKAAPGLQNCPTVYHQCQSTLDKTGSCLVTAYVLVAN